MRETASRSDRRQENGPMTKEHPREAPEKPSDKFARSDQAPPPGEEQVEQYLSDLDDEDVVEAAAEDSFPASDPPAYTTGEESADQAERRRASGR
jgi:hypothetical protein